jgi:hypothetical protein
MGWPSSSISNWPRRSSITMPFACRVSLSVAVTDALLSVR